MDENLNEPGCQTIGICGGCPVCGEYDNDIHGI